MADTDDEDFEMREEYDFSRSKPVSEVPHLKRFQEEAKGKVRITIMLDDLVIQTFRSQAEIEGLGYQTLINQTLRRHVTESQPGEPPLTEARLRQILREELGAKG
jgi:uncharacterized protein (DUF4415 family)